MYDVIIIGSGPSGMMASIEASKTKKVLVIEKNNICGKKMLITGGGRCNLTNLKNNNDFLNNINHNKKYLYSTINNYGPLDIYNFFISNNILLKEEEDNKIFPSSNKSKDIINCLVNNMKNVTINYEEKVIDIKINGDKKIIKTNKDIYTCKYLVIATGGSSYKMTGSSGDNIKFASMLNQPIVDIYPCEVGIVLKNNYSFLAGSSIDEVIIKYNKYNTKGNLLFTHKGLSGSSIMLMSEHIALCKDKLLYIDLLPNISKEEFINEIINYDRQLELKIFLNNYFSKKISSFLIDSFNLNVKIKSLNNKQIENMINKLKNFPFDIISCDNIDNAYVTGGGINMDYIDSKTMESKINKGVYFVGEALDIHGPIGGYNITLALSTGYTAGYTIKLIK